MSQPPQGGGMHGMAGSVAPVVPTGVAGLPTPATSSAAGGFGLEEIGIPGRDYLRKVLLIIKISLLYNCSSKRHQ